MRQSEAPLEPMLASSIFRRAFEQGASGPEASSARPRAGIATQRQGADEDPEVVRKMQEEEFQRRLRGEYEEAQARVGSVVRGVS